MPPFGAYGERYVGYRIDQGNLDLDLDDRLDDWYLKAQNHCRNGKIRVRGEAARSATGAGSASRAGRSRGANEQIFLGQVEVGDFGEEKGGATVLSIESRGWAPGADLE
jgi:hypothetical protein